MAETSTDPAVLKAQIAVKRARISDNLGELAVRLTPENLIHTGIARAREAARQEANKAMTDMNSLIDDITSDSIDWARENRGLLIGGAVLAAAAVAVSARKARTEKPVPLYAAYNQEYRVAEVKDHGSAGSRDVGAAWEKVKGEAEVLGNKAGEAYYAVRSKANVAGATAREAAHDAADLARVAAHDAAELAREAAAKSRIAAERAREAAADAGQWAKRQPDEHPASIIIIGIAVGAIIGAMLPGSRRENALMGSSRDSISGKVKHGAKQVIEAATVSLEDATAAGSGVRSRLDELVDLGRSLLADATSAAASRLRSRS